MASRLNARLDRIEQRSTPRHPPGLIDRVEALLGRLQAGGTPLTTALGFPGIPPMTPKPRGEANAYDACVWLLHVDAGHDADPGGACRTCQSDPSADRPGTERKTR